MDSLEIVSTFSIFLPLFRAENASKTLENTPGNEQINQTISIWGNLRDLLCFGRFGFALSKSLVKTALFPLLPSTIELLLLLLLLLLLPFCSSTSIFLLLAFEKTSTAVEMHIRNITAKVTPLKIHVVFR